LRAGFLKDLWPTNSPDETKTRLRSTEVYTNKLSTIEDLKGNFYKEIAAISMNMVQFEDGCLL
jgi:hypothetical protein